MGNGGKFAVRDGSGKGRRRYLEHGDNAFNPPGHGPGPAFRHSELPCGGSVTITSANVHGKPFNMKISHPADANLFSIMIPFSGNGGMRFWNGANVEIDFGAMDILTTPTGGEVDFTILPGEPYNAIGLEYPEKTRFEALEEIRLPGAFSTLRKQRFSEPETMKMTMPQEILRLAMDINANPYRGAAARYFEQARHLEILAAFLWAVDERKAFPSERTVWMERRRIHEAREILMANIANPPSLIELSGMAGMNYKKLNRGFRAEFGLTVHAFVIERRLEMARRAIELEGLTVAEAAYRSGYSHLANFTKAFQKKFGFPPGEIKKRHF